MKKFLLKSTLLCAALTAAPTAFASIDGGISLPAFGTVYGEAGQEFGFYVTVTNKCDEPLTSISYKVVKAPILSSSAALNEIVDTDLPEYTLDLSANPLAVSSAYPLLFKAVAPEDVNDTNKMQIRLKTLNGQVFLEKVKIEEDGKAERDTLVEKRANGRVSAVNYRPEYRSCVEDYTGTWCMWCPRGYVALEQLNRDFPDLALTVAYHYGDIMQTGKFVNPVTPNGYPYITLNRVEGSNYLSSLGTKIMMNSNTYTPCGVTMLDSYWSDADHTNAIGVAEIEFANDIVDGEYAIEFALIENGLHDPLNGEDPKTAAYWTQENAYASNAAAWSDPLWDIFEGKESPVAGLTYNDVCLMNSLKSANGLVASIPATSARTKLTYTMTFADVNNIVRYKTNMLMEPEKCRIACIITKNGKYVNCHWMNVANASAGVNTVAADDNVDLNAPKEYFNISGQKVNADNLTPGLYIVRQGNHTSKVVIR